jgi:predicted esterase
MFPHGDQPVSHAGAALSEARVVAVMVHGRGAEPASILEVADALAVRHVAYVAPAAAGRTWYPYSFLADFEMNEPGLSSGLARLGDVVSNLETTGFSKERILFLGFSQGACLAAEFTVRNAARYGGLVVLSGGLIGPPGTTWQTEGDFSGMPVFLGCSDADAHIPVDRFKESAKVFRRMGASVTDRLYPGMGHSINEDELAFARGMLEDLVAD